MDFSLLQYEEAWRKSVTQSSEQLLKAKFRYNKMTYLVALKYQVEHGIFKPSVLKEMIVRYPKERVVQVPSIADKILQHLICDNYLTAALEKPLIDTVSACITGRGDDYAAKYVKKFLHKHYMRHHTKNFYVLKCDIKSFFATIPHDQMFIMLRRYIKDDDILNLVKKFVEVVPDDIGMALGLQQSHICGNLYLSDLDHYCKEVLHAEMYGRHMDDFYIISDDYQYLADCLEKIKVFVERKGLSLNPKTHIQHNHFDFLGFKYHLTDSGKIVKTLLKDKRNSKHRELRKKMNAVLEGKIPVQKFLDGYNGWRVHAFRGDCGALVHAWDLTVIDKLKGVARITVTKKGLRQI